MSGDPPAGRVTAIYRSERAGAPMLATPEAEAVAGRGLVGDRYAGGRGRWSDACQVTLIAAGDLAAVARDAGVKVDAGEHRRNVVVEGLAVADLVGRTFRAGEAVLAGEAPRPPCRYLEELTEPGMQEALEGRGGICARVQESGRIRVGDPVAVLGTRRGVNPVEPRG